MQGCASCFRLLVIDDLARVFLILWTALVARSFVLELFCREDRRALTRPQLLFLDCDLWKLLLHCVIPASLRLRAQRRHILSLTNNLIALAIALIQKRHSQQNRAQHDKRDDSVELLQR